jgi:prepilin-type N-terminal cleavage/methylation domain-containing protein
MPRNSWLEWPVCNQRLGFLAVGPFSANFSWDHFPWELTMKKQSGFTLIELLLVLAIIGIISAIAIPALLGQRERAKAKAVQGNVNNIAGECARINDTAKEAGSVLGAVVICSSALSLPNYSLPNAKNPYNGSLAAYSTGGTATGTVVAVGSNVLDVTGNSYSAVVITGYYLVGGTMNSMQKVVALD